MSQQLEADLAKCREELEHLRLIQEHATDMISRHAPNDAYTYPSPAATRLTGYAPEELVGRDPYDFFHPDDMPAVSESHSTIIDTPDVFTVAYRLKRKDGNYIWFETTSKTIRDTATNEVLEIIAVSCDITKRKTLELDLHNLAREDQLTGLPRPHVFHKELDQALKRAKRAKSLVAVLYIDLDKFKSINDNYGHLVGDNFLKAFGKRLSQGVRGGELAARLGGDEFGAILENIQSLDEAQSAAQRLIDLFEKPLKVGKLRIQGDFSMGISLFPEQASNAEILLQQADTAMYAAKALDKTIAFAQP